MPGCHQDRHVGGKGTEHLMQLQYSTCRNTNALHSLVPRLAVLESQFPAPDELSSTGLCHLRSFERPRAAA